jgi:hypothetical protein
MRKFFQIQRNKIYEKVQQMRGDRQDPPQYNRRQMSQALQKCRLASGRTQEDLAEEAHMPLILLQWFESPSAARRPPSIWDHDDYARALDHQDTPGVTNVILAVYLNQKPQADGIRWLENRK